MSTVVRYSNAVNSLIKDIFSTAYTPAPKAQSFRPSIDIVEHEKEYKLYADLAGLSKENVAITVEDGVLAISGEKKPVAIDDDRYRYIERNSGTFERKFNLPEEVDVNAISADMKDGVLTVSIGKLEKALPKKIDIQIS